MPTLLSANQWTNVNQIKLEATKPFGWMSGFPPTFVTTRLQFEIYKRSGIFSSTLYNTYDSPFSFIGEPQSITDTYPDGSYAWRVRAVSSPPAIQESDWVNYPSTLLQADFRVDTTPPTGSISINGGAEYTNSSIVDLNLSALDVGIGNAGLEMLVYNPYIFCFLGSCPVWQPYSNVVNNWNLKSGEGTKTVLIKYRDSLTNTSGEYNDTIIVDKTAPSVASTGPADTATNVPINSNASAVLNESTIDPANVNSTTFSLSNAGTAVAGAVTFDAATKTLVFNPNTDLANSTVYTAKITTGLKDLAGNSMAADKTWTFTTQAAPVTSSPAGTTPGGTTPGGTAPGGQAPSGGSSQQILNTLLSLSAHPKAVRAGKATTIKGQLKDSSGKPVVGKKVVLKQKVLKKIKKKVKGKIKTIKKWIWKAIATLTTDSKGNFAKKLKPKTTMVYKAEFGGDSAYKKANSNTVKVTVNKVKKKKKK